MHISLDRYDSTDTSHQKQNTVNKEENYELCLQFYTTSTRIHLAAKNSVNPTTITNFEASSAETNEKYN